MEDVEISYSFRIMAIFYLINWIGAAETIEGGKLFKEGNYSRKYSIKGCNNLDYKIKFFKSI